MAIVATDILYKYSVAAAAGNTTASAQATSLGDQISTTQITDNVLNNVFDDVSGDDNAGSVVDYRCVFVHNNHGSLTYQGVKLWMASEVAGGTSFSIGVDPAAASALASGATQAATIANELSAPAGVTFTAPTTKGAGVTIGDLAPGQVRAFWIRRTAANTAALNNDGATFRVEGDTAA